VRNGTYELDDTPGLGFDLVEEELDHHPGVTIRRAGFYV
jgi:galactonate dehydratase